MVHIGTSGWTYKDWENIFYPPGLPNKKWLEFYSKEFQTVEINASFYHQMRDITYQNWYKTTPNNFVFSVKVSRFITHIKKLNDPKESWERFINNAKYLKKKLGPILFQLPPSLKANKKNLIDLLDIIPKKYRIAFEPRHESWFQEDIYKVFKKYDSTLVIAESGGKWPSYSINSLEDGRINGISTSFVYLRMHGPGGSYDSKYKDAQLEKWAKKIKGWQKNGLDVYVYFNNDAHGYAVDNAKKLKDLIK